MKYTVPVYLYNEDKNTFHRQKHSQPLFITYIREENRMDKVKCEMLRSGEKRAKQLLPVKVLQYFPNKQP